MTRVHTHYDNLKVMRNAPPEVIKASFRALSQRYHPDKNSSPDATRIMTILNEAYKVLGDPEARRLYDATIAEDQPNPSTEAPTDSAQQASVTPEHKARTDGQSKPAQPHYTEQASDSFVASTDWRFLAGLLFAALLLFGLLSLR